MKDKSKDKSKTKLVIFRRHTAACRAKYQKTHGKGKLPGRKLLTCGCPFHVEGYFAGEYIRKALDTTSAVEAVAVVNRHRERGKWVDAPVPAVRLGGAA